MNRLTAYHVSKWLRKHVRFPCPIPPQGNYKNRIHMPDAIDPDEASRIFRWFLPSLIVEWIMSNPYSGWDAWLLSRVSDVLEWADLLAYLTGIYDMIN